MTMEQVNVDFSQDVNSHSRFLVEEYRRAVGDYNALLETPNASATDVFEAYEKASKLQKRCMGRRYALRKKYTDAGDLSLLEDDPEYQIMEEARLINVKLLPKRFLNILPNEQLKRHKRSFKKWFLAEHKNLGDNFNDDVKAKSTARYKKKFKEWKKWFQKPDDRRWVIQQFHNVNHPSYLFLQKVGIPTPTEDDFQVASGPENTEGNSDVSASNLSMLADIASPSNENEQIESTLQMENLQMRIHFEQQLQELRTENEQIRQHLRELEERVQEALNPGYEHIDGMDFFYGADAAPG